MQKKLNVNELYDFVKEFYGYKCRMLGYNSEKKEIMCILYESFFLKCGVGDKYEMFGAGIVFSANEDICLTDFLNQRCSLNSDEQSIKESLELIDNYCRLRLPDKFLEAHCKAYRQ
jgi:hypothetical protein